jgi:hypothetical protein
MTTAVKDRELVRPRLSSRDVWNEVKKASFAVLSYATPTGEPRASGVVYKAIGRRLYIATDPDSWKARHITRSGRVAMTVPVRRGGLLSLVVPIPPATISFHGSAVVHPADAPEVRPLLDELKSLLPDERRSDAVIIEVAPEDRFVTYGIGVSLSQMRDPVAAGARVPVTGGGTP